MKVEEPITDYTQLNPNALYTFWDYMKWQFSERVELIHGRVVKMSPSPDLTHQKTLRQLNNVIFERFKSKLPCEVVFAPFDVRLPIPGEEKPYTVVQPDLCIICDPEKLKGHGCNGAPDLVVEILSRGNSSYDLEVKYKLYEEAKVPEYWIVDPHSQYINVFTLVEGKYEGLRPKNGALKVESYRFPQLDFTADEVFEGLSPDYSS